jgi:putative FmdB family regulatory protein
MPVYEYVCEKCGRFEYFHRSISEELLVKCPTCGNDIKKVFSSSYGLVFKGSGFYATDYRDPSYGVTTEKDLGID